MLSDESQVPHLIVKTSLVAMDPFRQTFGPESRPKAASKRVQSACLRCHKQKLKCDNERPCALCIRSSMECVENTPRTRQSHAAKPKSKDRSTSSSRQSSSLSGRPSPSFLGRSEQSYSERLSTYPLVNHMFEKYNSPSGVLSNADAIPGGSSSQRISPNDVERISLFDLIGMDLPTREITNVLLESYLKRIHWFIMVIHEPSLRGELEDILTHGTVQPTRLSFLILVLVILGFGSNYITDEEVKSLDPSYDRRAMERAMIKKAEENFLDVCDTSDIEVVQTGMILSSYQVYFGKPKRASIIFDITMTCAKAMGLHQESLWAGVDPLTKEIRRRTWWAVYAGDRFTAMNFGRPCLISDAECDVQMVRNINDPPITCPGFSSTETFEDGSVGRVTIFSYPRWKYKLYQIVSTILHTIYFCKGTNMTFDQSGKKVEDVHERLRSWERTIPAELRLTSYNPHDFGPEKGHVWETFQLQALALNVFYNNIQLLLHRPLLTYTGFFRKAGSSRSSKSGPSTSTSGASATLATHFDSRRYQLSRNQSWDSAIQTSKIIEYKDLLLAARNTPVAHYVGIPSFTAGAVLGLFALSAPLTNVSLEAKRALGNLITIPQLLVEFHSLASDQCANILRELMSLILAEETRMLTVNLENAAKESISDPTSVYAELPNQMVHNLLDQRQQGQQFNQMTPNSVETTQLSYPNVSAPLVNVFEKDENGFAYNNGQLPFQDNFPATAGAALLSLQNAVFSDDRIRMGVQLQYNEDPSAMMPFSSTAPPSNSFNAETDLEDRSQTWIWGDNFDFR